MALTGASRSRSGYDVLVHASGGGEIGFGHLGRCIALAETFVEKNQSVAFMPPSDQRATHYLLERGFQVVDDRVDAGVEIFDSKDPADPATVRSAQRSIVVDDFGEARLYADVTVYPPTSRPHELDWRAAEGEWVEGFAYALVRREFRECSSASARELVLVILGGSDAFGLLDELLPMVLEGAGDRPVGVLCGPGMSERVPSGVRAIQEPTSLADVFARSAVAVTTYGHTPLELAACGTPAIIVSQTPDAAFDAEEFCRAGSAFHLADRAALVSTLDWLLSDASAARGMSIQGRSLVDGRGAERVLALLSALAHDERPS